MTKGEMGEGKVKQKVSVTHNEALIETYYIKSDFRLNISCVRYYGSTISMCAMMLESAFSI